MINQFMVSKMLKDWNIEVSDGENGDKALERLKEEDFDLVLMDTHMPGINGYQAAAYDPYGF
jgi:CheY-like chemotaxis protein